MNHIEIGRLLRSGTRGCVVGCRVMDISAPSFGGLVLIPPAGEAGISIYGIIYDIHIDDDGLVRQLVTADSVSEEVILDNRINRNVPLEISVLFVGYEHNGEISHMLPPRPPLTLDRILLCTDEDLIRFTPISSYGYFRHILRAEEIPVADVFAAHLSLVSQAHQSYGYAGWLDSASKEIITMLRDDYPLLMDMLGAIKDTRLFDSQY
jgi:hypothetical protein